jgi:hypothetical protein
LREVTGMANPISVARNVFERLEELPAPEERE